MRIVNRATFMAMPAGTVFAKVDQYGNGMERLQILLGRSGDIDFVCREMIEIDAESGELRMDAIDCGMRGAHVPLDWDLAGGRDGLFDQDQRFAVLDRDEATALVMMLTAAIKGDVL